MDQYPSRKKTLHARLYLYANRSVRDPHQQTTVYAHTPYCFKNGREVHRSSKMAEWILIFVYGIQDLVFRSTPPYKRFRGLLAQLPVFNPGIIALDYFSTDKFEQFQKPQAATTTLSPSGEGYKHQAF